MFRPRPLGDGSKVLGYYYGSLKEKAPAWAGAFSNSHYCCIAQSLNDAYKAFNGFDATMLSASWYPWLKS